MGKKGGWFSSVKKALSPDSKEKKAEKTSKLKKKWFGKDKPSVSDSPNRDYIEVSHPHPLLQVEVVKLTEANEQTEHVSPVAVAIDTASEAAVSEAEAAAEVVRPSMVPRFAGKSEEEVAAIKIQTTFRGYLARRALRALRGLVRLKSLVDGPIANRQTANTLKCMQTLSRVQSQIQSRRIRMLEENMTLQRQLVQKRAKELESLRMGEEWDYSLQSKEQIEASLLHKYEAAMRRERALAYSYTHQQTWKKTAKSTNLLFMDPTNPHWGWSWLERLMASGPLDETSAEKDLNGDSLSIKTASLQGEITKSFARHHLNSDNLSPLAGRKPPSTRHSPPTPSSKAVRKLKPVGMKESAVSQDENDDSRSVLSVQTERNRRHSVASSLVRDDESLASSPGVPSYMATTHSAKAKLKLPSPLGTENGMDHKGSSPASAKKRLSFPASPARPRRHSGPPRVDTSSVYGSEVDEVMVISR